jgi:hypothetical protein
MARKHVLLLETDSVQWQPFHEIFPGDAQAGKWAKALSRDPDTGAVTCLIKFEKGWSDNRDVYHRCGEEVFIVSGRFKIGGRVMEAGAYAYRPPLTLHGAAEALEETIMYISWDGDGSFFTDSGYEYVE